MLDEERIRFEEGRLQLKQNRADVGGHARKEDYYERKRFLEL